MQLLVQRKRPNRQLLRPWPWLRICGMLVRHVFLNERMVGPQK